MPTTIDHAAATVTVDRVEAYRAVCSCGWQGPIRIAQAPAFLADGRRHRRQHEAIHDGYRLLSPVGVNDFAEHAHGGPLPEGSETPNTVPVTMLSEPGQPPEWSHRHDGGGSPHRHGEPW